MLSVRSYLSIIPSELLTEVLLLLPPKEILSKDSDLEEFKRVCSQETFWERVWRKWVSPRLPKQLDRTIRETISELVEKAKGRTPEDLLLQGSFKGILFYVLEALERGSEISMIENLALQEAAANGYFEIVRYLVEEGGANLSAREDEALRHE